MNALTFNFLQKCCWLFGLVVLFFGCERELDELSPVTNPTNPEVFINSFSPGLNYAAFGGSVPTAFQVDEEVTYSNLSTASMRFDVPDVGDPRGAYAGGTFFTEAGRDLSGYNALTFWAKASKAANIDLVGFGNDLGANTYVATVSNLPVTTSWQRYIIPLPDPSKLTNERGMFFYSEGAEEGRGYTFWVDEVKFENLAGVAHQQATILGGQDQTETSFIGVSKGIDGLSVAYNLPTGVNQAVNAGPAYFDFSSSDPSIATVNANGVMSVVGGPGQAVITATLGGLPVRGSLTVNSVGNFVRAPTPTRNPADVISIYTEAYPNVPVNYYNGFWQPYQTTGSADFTVEGDNVLHYTNFNFVGIEFSAPTVNASAMTHLHMDIFVPNDLPSDARLRLEVVDFGAEQTGRFTATIPATRTQEWVSLDIPFSSLAGLNVRSALAQIIFVNENGVVSNFYADNIYFYR